MKYCFLILMLTLLISCNKTNNKDSEVYKNNQLNSHTGIPKDSNTFYLPSKMKLRDAYLKNDMDTLISKWMSSMLYFMKEPVLYDHYLGKDIYRLFWLNKRPVVISLTRDKSKILLNTKILSHAPNPNGTNTIVAFNNPKNIYDSTKNTYVTFYSFYAQQIDLPPLKVILNKTKVLSEKEWNTFSDKLNSINFHYLFPSNETFIYNGGTKDYTLETHFQTRYWVVHRNNPDYNFQECCEYLINISDAKDELIYFNR